MSNGSLVQRLRDTRVLVIHPQDRDGDELVRQLKRIGCRVGTTWPMPGAMPEDADVVYVMIGADQSSKPAWLNTDLRAALIAVIDFENPTTLKDLLDCNAHGVIVRPIRAAGVLATMVVALANRSYETRLLVKVAKLEENLKARREIEKATRIIMELRGYSEPNAYEFIRQQATAKRISTAKMAASIINAQDVLNALGGG
jgi:AmiR/NasT family two-component response regulator